MHDTRCPIRLGFTKRAESSDTLSTPCNDCLPKPYLLQQSLKAIKPVRLSPYQNFVPVSLGCRQGHSAVVGQTVVLEDLPIRHIDLATDLHSEDKSEEL